MSPLLWTACDNNTLLPELSKSPSSGQNTESPLSLDYDPSHFPETDHSDALSATNPIYNFRKLIKAFDPQRALDISSFYNAYDPEYSLDNNRYAEMKKKADEIVKDCKNEYEKLRALHKYVFSHMTYDNNGTGRNDPYGAFKGELCVCQGYANVLRVLLNTQQIPCLNVNGNLFQGDLFIGAHAWNYVFANGKWYVDDPTNDKIYEMEQPDSYKDLRPLMTDTPIFEDENFVYDYYDGQLNIGRVKSTEEILTIPYSTHNFRIKTFNLHSSLPSTIKQIYIGRNIISLGEQSVGLSHNPGNEEKIYVDPKNTKLGSENGIVYLKDRKGKLSQLLYIPAAMNSVKLLPIERLEKNVIVNHKGIQELILVPGTKVLENYAIESCPNLQRIYLPTDCRMEKFAIYRCPTNIQIFRGDFTGIARIRK